jgi:hypothetical protein
MPLTYTGPCDCPSPAIQSTRWSSSHRGHFTDEDGIWCGWRSGGVDAKGALIKCSQAKLDEMAVQQEALALEERRAKERQLVSLRVQVSQAGDLPDLKAELESQVAQLEAELGL